MAEGHRADKPYRLRQVRSGFICGNGLWLPFLDMRQTVFERDQTTIDYEKLGVRRTVPVLLCLLIRGTFVPRLGRRHIGEFYQDDTFKSLHRL